MASADREAIELKEVGREDNADAKNVKGGGEATPPSYMSNWLLSFMGLVAMFGPVQGSMYTVALREMKKSLGTSTALIGLSLSAFLYSAAVFPVPAGPAADMYGRRPVLYFGLVCFLIGSFLCAAAQSIYGLIAYRAIQGLGYAVCSVIPSAVVSDMVPRELKGQYVGVIWAYIFAGPGVGPVLGGFLTEHLGWRSLFILLGAWSAAMIIWTPAVVPETKHLSSGKPAPQPRPRVSKLKALTLLGEPRVLWPVLCATATFGTLWGTSFLFPSMLYELYGMRPSVVGLLMVIRSAGSVVGVATVRRAVDRLGPLVVLRAASAATGIVTVLIATTTGEHVSGLLVILFAFGTCAATSMTAADALLIKEHPEKAASIVACLQFSIKIWAAIVVTVLGVVIDTLGYRFVFYLLGVQACLGALPLFTCYRPRAAHRAPEPLATEPSGQTGEKVLETGLSEEATLAGSEDAKSPDSARVETVNL